MNSNEPVGPSGDFTWLWTFADAELDEALRELRVGGCLVEIEPRPFDLLLLLLRHADSVVSNEEIIANTWAGRIVNDAPFTNVANAISKLRKLIKDDHREIIKTVPKVGYRFAATVERRLRPGRQVDWTLKLHDFVPGRPHWCLSERQESSGYGDVWIGINTKTQEQRVFKFCFDDHRLSALKREATLFRILRQTLADKAPVPALLEWQFETAPYYTEAERWGQDLRSWAEHNGGLHNIPLGTRLEILALTAEMVTAVHSVGVLHKDLKPQNILVQGKGDALQVRLCDFGTGLLLNSPSLEALAITRLGFTHTVVGAGTPCYMAPELMAGDTPTLQADIYSLGVLLYQLAIGEWRPMAFGWDADVDDELLKEDIATSIHRYPSARPSSALLLAQRIRSLSERREQLDREREAELQNAALMESMKRSRARRPWMLAAAGVLLIAVGVSSLLMLKARRAADIAAENERIAKSVADFLIQDMVHQASPDYGGRVDVTLKEAVLESVPKISERLNGNLPVAAVLYQSLADSLASLSDPFNAAKLAHEAAQLYTNLYGKSDRRVLLARMDEFTYRLLTESAMQVAVEFDPLDEGIRKTFPGNDPVALKAALVRASVASMQGRDQEAIPMFEQILSQSTAQLDAEGFRWLDRTRVAYIRSLALNAQYDAVRDQAIKELPHFEKTYGSNSRLSLELKRYLGRAYAAERGQVHDFAAAEAQFSDTIKGMKSLYGADSTEHDFALMDLGDLYLLGGRWAEAEEIHRKLVSDFEDHYGSSSFWTWRARSTLMASLIGQARSNIHYLRPSLELAVELLVLARSTLPENDYIQGRILFICAIPLIMAEHHEEASRVINDLDSFKNRLVASPVEISLHGGELNYLRGLLAQSNHQKDAAIAYLMRAAEELTPLAGPDSMEVRDINQQLMGLRNKDLAPKPESR